MTETIKVKGHEIKPFNRKLGSFRRAQIIANGITKILRKMGVHEDDIEIPLQKLVIRKVEASVEWWYEEYYLYFSYKLAGSFIENLHVIAKAIELQAAAVEAGDMTMDEFNRSFAEDNNIKEQRKNARKTLNLAEDCLDVEIINKQYKLLAMKHHPDRPEGDHEMFKKINNAHKILKRELS